MHKRLLTLDDLSLFVKNNNMQTFNSKNTGYELAVQIPAKIDFNISDNDNTKDMMFVKIYVAHTDLNLNHSFIAEEDMKREMYSLKYRPVLAFIHQLDNGEWDFHSHDIDIDENGDFIYIEKQVGAFTADDPYLEENKENGKKYVVATAAIPEMYTKTAEILRKKQITNVSCELIIEDMSFNAEKDYLQLNKFYFSGCTLLGSESDGTKVNPGMENARIDIEDFSLKNNSVCEHYNFEKQINGLDAKMDEILQKFDALRKNQGKGGANMDKLNELLNLYSKTIEDINFEWENLTDEELVEKFKTEFEVVETEENTEEVENSDNEPETESENEEDNENEPETEENEPEAFELHFELSHDDIRRALYELLDLNNNNSGYWIIEVFDNYFIYEDYENRNFYKQQYGKTDENVALSGERVEIFSEWLTQEEKDKLNDMKNNYEQLSEFKSNYEKKKEKEEKELILNQVEYQEIKDNKNFEELTNDIDNYSLEEIKTKADLIFAQVMKEKLEFNNQKDCQTNIIHKHINAKAKRKPYGGLFED